MKIISFNSSVISESLNDNFKVEKMYNNSIISMLNNAKTVSNLKMSNKSKVIISDIQFSGEYVFIDFLQEIKDFLLIKDNYILKELIPKDESFNKSIFRNINRLSIDIDIYREALKAFSNKIIRNIKAENIILIKLYIDEETKFVNGQAQELNENEKNEIKKMNEYLSKLYKLHNEIMPYTTTVDIENKLYMENVQSVKLYIDEKLKLDLNEKIEEKIKSMHEFSGEKIHPSVKNIRYYYEKAKIYNKDKLIIVFSAFSSDKAKYNYISTLKFIDCNKLFILDEYGIKGTYYIGLNGEMDIETSVMSLISKIMSENNISFKNVISVGSSKGGTAALYYGMKYNFGNIICGAPQYKMGTYLSELTVKEYGKEIFGGLNEANRIKYDNLIKLCSSRQDIPIYILTGDGDNQYKRVLKEFEDVSKEFNLKLNIDKCDIKNHAEISLRFPEYMNSKLQDILKKGYVKSSVFNKVVRGVKRFCSKGLFK